MYEVFPQDPIPEYQCAMEARKRDVVPAETSGGACFESGRIVFEVGDDHLHNLGREVALMGCVWRPVSEGADELGFGTAPEGVGEELDPWNKMMRRDGGKDKVRFAGYLAENTRDFLEAFRHGLSST